MLYLHGVFAGYGDRVVLGGLINRSMMPPVAIAIAEVIQATLHPYVEISVLRSGDATIHVQ